MGGRIGHFSVLDLQWNEKKNNEETIENTNSVRNNY
jgi:hypothetical protein